MSPSLHSKRWRRPGSKPCRRHYRLETFDSGHKSGPGSRAARSVVVGGNMEIDPAQFADRLVSGISDAVVYADAEGVIRRWNRGASRIFGFAEAEAIGRSLDIIIPAGLRERHWQGFRATMRTGRSRYGDGQVLSVPAVRKDGARISVEFIIVPFTDDSGRMNGIAAIMRDVTARFEELRSLRRQLAAQPAANRAGGASTPTNR